MKNKADILIIDDDRDLVNSMKIILESRALNVRTAGDGKAGYESIRNKTPDLIILDVMMATDTEGFDLAYKLRRESVYQDIPILMVTSFPKHMAEQGPEKFQHIMGENWPVTQFLEKPIDPDDLLSAVMNLLSEADGHDPGFF
ncbi:MAG: response regulator [Proteobacteria bacterium]|nr:response regulator [Pseudomonadota bacterium]